MAKGNGFQDMADYLGKLIEVDPVQITLESLTDTAEFYLEQLLPVIPESLLKKKHARDHVKVDVQKDYVQVVFEDTAFYWRFPENGTVNQKAQHFASGTYEKNITKIEDIMTQRILDLWKG